MLLTTGDDFFEAEEAGLAEEGDAAIGAAAEEGEFIACDSLLGLQPIFLAVYRYLNNRGASKLTAQGQGQTTQQKRR